MKKPRRDPLNEFPFTCRTCQTRFQVAETRIVGKNCRSCALAAGWISTHTQKVPDPRICANCHTEIAHRRAVSDKHGRIVHYRCPGVTRHERQARAAPA
jgi:hypothetical protein